MSAVTLLESLADRPRPETEFTPEAPLSSMAAQLVETAAIAWFCGCTHEIDWPS